MGGFAFLVLLQVLLGFNLFDAQFWGRFSRVLWQGFLGTLFYVAIVIPVSIGLGFVAGWARVSSYRTLAWPVSVYVDLVRGIPPIVLIIFAFIFAPVRDQQSAILFAALALAVHSSAYQAEIFRAGFQSVSRGQVEAAHAVGLDRWQTMGSVILPQAMRLSLPPLANEFATLLKDTSLLGALGAIEMTARGLDFSYQTLGQLSWVFAIWTTVSLFYFLLTFAVTRVLLLVEKWYRVPGMEGVTAT